MGGALAIAIRRTNGTEYISERWTNPLPHWLSNPAFWDDGVVVDEYIKNGLENYTPVDRVFPSEYGTVVIDFQTKRVFSRQDYCGVDNLTCAIGCMDAEDAEHVLKMIELDWVTRYQVVRHAPHDASEAERETALNDQDLHPDEVELFHKFLRVRTANDFKPGMVILHFKVPGWTVDDGKTRDANGRSICSFRAWQVWSEVEGAIKEMGWKSPCWTQAEVDAEFKHDEDATDADFEEAGRLTDSAVADAHEADAEAN